MHTQAIDGEKELAADILLLGSLLSCHFLCVSSWFRAGWERRSLWCDAGHKEEWAWAFFFVVCFWRGFVVTRARPGVCLLGGSERVGCAWSRSWNLGRVSVVLYFSLDSSSQ
jgi:hypothetical protein